MNVTMSMWYHCKYLPIYMPWALKNSDALVVEFFSNIAMFIVGVKLRRSPFFVRNATYLVVVRSWKAFSFMGLNNDVYFFPRSPLHSFIPLIRLNFGDFFLKHGKENHSQLSEVLTYVRETTLFVPIKNHSHFTNIILKWHARPKIKIQFFKYGAALR